MLRRDLTLDRHAELLLRHLSFFSGWEPLVEARLAPWYSDRVKRPLLQRDLRSLGFDSAEIAQIPVFRPLPALDTLPELLGSLYVVEGSTLGGQLISRHLEDVLALSDGVGYSYYCGYGRETAERWRGFLRLLESHSPPDSHEQIVTSAVATFDAMRQCLTSPKQ